MRVRGAIHIHSSLSHDGTMTIAEMAAWFRSRGFHFIAMGEHSQDMNAAKVRALVEESAAQSREGFHVIPGIEYTCQPREMHILGIGALGLTAQTDPVQVARGIREQGGLAVLTHPRRVGWQCAPELLCEVDAVEIWNLAYDGKYLPSMQAPSAFRRMKETNPKLLALASHDAHRTSGFYDIAVEMDVPELATAPILENLRQGKYRIVSRFFSAHPKAPFSWADALYLRVFGAQLSGLRKARTLWLRWSS